MGRFEYCLNTSTIRTPGATVLEYVDIAADAGYEGIEPWVEEIDAWVEGGGTLEQLRDRAAGRGIRIVNLIAFFEWAVPEEDRHARGLEEARRCFEMAQVLECPFVATAPKGIHDRQVDLFSVARRFAELTEAVSDFSPKPLLEFWGVARTLGTVGEALLVAAESGVRDARLLTDIFHMYKGSGHQRGMDYLDPGRLGLVHVNDYPSVPVRAVIEDEHRVYPGDGEAPWDEIVASLERQEYRGMLSLELFNPAYWAEGPVATARKGLEKLRACVESA
ncbi:MAG: sugar phosphate isomerase/epimerase [Gemmatimonadetes bacterium]|nr:sugar phosphate isomerase/epimerase [Gemmatimonadota bacterium]